jgi:hypothetical protein
MQKHFARRSAAMLLGLAALAGLSGSCPTTGPANSSCVIVSDCNTVYSTSTMCLCDVCGCLTYSFAVPGGPAGVTVTGHFVAETPDCETLGYLKPESGVCDLNPCIWGDPVGSGQSGPCVTLINGSTQCWAA